MKKWRSERIEQLERELSEALKREQHKDATIANLRNRVQQLESETLSIAEQIVSHIRIPDD